MRNRLLVILCGLVMAAVPAYAFELLSSPTEDIMPIRDIVPGDNGVTVSYSFPGAVITEDDLYPDTYNVSIPGFGNNMEPGMPGWPQRWDSFVIPEGCDANVTLLSVSTETKSFILLRHVETCLTVLVRCIQRIMSNRWLHIRALCLRTL